jgi:hypothetical protein
LGSVPITNLKQEYHEHLKEADHHGVLYDNDMENLTRLQVMQERLSELPPPVTVNRNTVFEEYYMEYVEREVGRPLRWWDVVSQRPGFLDEFAVSLPPGVPPSK